MVFEEKHHMPWAYDAYEAYEAYKAYEPNFREDVVNAFHRRYDAGQTDRRDRSQQGHGRKGACKDAGAV